MHGLAAQYYLAPMAILGMLACVFFFSSRRRHTRCSRDWSSDVCSSDLVVGFLVERLLISFLGVRRVMIDPLEASELQPALDILRLFFRDLLILLDGVPDHFIIHAPLLRITDEARINVA